MTNSRGAAKQGVPCVQLGLSPKERQKPLLSLCTNDLQKGGGTGGLLYVLEAFILPVSTSGSLENVVKQGFDSSCTSWPSWLFNPVMLTILKHICKKNLTKDFS